MSNCVKDTNGDQEKSFKMTVNEGISFHWTLLHTSVCLQTFNPGDSLEMAHIILHNLLRKKIQIN